MMKRTAFVLAALLATMSLFAFVACDDEPTQDEANEAFCDDVAELIASLRVIEDLNRTSSVEEVEAARERAREAYDNMLESAAGVVEVQLDDLQEAYDALRAVVDDIDDEATLSEALETVDDELANVAAEASKVLNNVDCGTTDDGSQSDE